MLLAANITLLEWVLLATILITGGGVLWRAFSGPRGSGGASHHEKEESERAQARAEGRIAHLEVRLHDFAREVEARMETRALKLDSLVVASDREIVRLSVLLNQLSDSLAIRQPDITHFDTSATKPAAAVLPCTAPEASLSPAQAEMVGHLNEAGYSVPEIAQIVGQPAETVSAVLKKAA
jgi:hypothetical protein